MKKEITFPISDKDQTAFLRPIIADTTITNYQFTQGNSEIEVLCTGMMEGDGDLVPKGDLGAYGIIRLENRKDVILSGKSIEDKTLIYTKEPAVADGDRDGDHITEADDPTNSSNMSQRKFFRVLGCENILVENFEVRSNNDTPVFKAGRPEYEARFEFEHGFDIQDSKNITLRNLYARYIWGDGVYLKNVEDVLMENVTIDWNGRQGGAVISGKNIVIDNFKVLNSRRSGFDVEGNSTSDDAGMVVIKNSSFNTHLLGLPMGGAGAVSEVLSVKNDYLKSNPFYSRGDGNTRKRSKIILSHCHTQLLGSYEFTNDILIENNYNDVPFYFGVGICTLTSCKNVVIRNNKIALEKEIVSPFWSIELKGTTTLDDVKFYNNDMPIKVILQDGTIVDPPEYIPTEEEKNSIPFEVSERFQYEYDVALDRLEQPIPEPIPEPKEEVEPPKEETPEAVIPPIETDAEAVATMARLLAYVKKNFKLIAIVAIAVIVLGLCMIFF